MFTAPVTLHFDRDADAHPHTHSLTWYTGDAEDVRVTDKEALQDVSRLVGINDDSLGGRLSAGTNPHQ